MGYLVLSRKEGEEIQISIDPGVDTDKLLHRLLRDGITSGLIPYQAAMCRLALKHRLRCWCCELN